MPFGLDPASLVFSVIGGYLLGSISFAEILARRAHIDLAKVGSGNRGATNMLRTGHWGLAALTLFGDIAKGAAALLTAALLFGHVYGLIAGFCAFLGHCFPFWLKFKGGKGVATFFGLVAAAMPLVFVGAALVWIMVAAVFRYSSLAALCATVSAPIFAVAFHQDAMDFWFAVTLAASVWAMHLQNILRLYRGEETKLAFPWSRAA